MKGSKKIGIAGEAQCFLNLSHGTAVSQQRLCRGYFLYGDIVADRGMNVSLKQPGEIVRMQAGLPFRYTASKGVEMGKDSAVWFALGSPLGKIGITDPLEPHLFCFSGFAGLERGKSIASGKTGKALSGAEAFALAYDSLQSLLQEIDITSK